MTDEEKTAAELAEAEKQAKEKAEAEAKAKADELNGKKVEEDGLDFYKNELTKTQELLKKKDEIIGYKDKAIESLKNDKKKDKENDEETVVINNRIYNKSDVETIKELAKGELGELGKKIDSLTESLKISQVETLIQSMSSDIAERELIKLHYLNSVKHTNDVMNDLKNARLLANRAFIYNEGLKEGMERKREEVMASFSGVKSSVSKENSNEADTNDPAYQLVAKINPEALKNSEALKKLRR